MMGVKGISRKSMKYAPLQQSFSDEEDFEVEILFNDSSKQSGYAKKDHLIDLQDLSGSCLQQGKPLTNVQIYTRWLKIVSRILLIFVVYIGIISIATVVTLQYFKEKPPLFKQTSAWSVQYKELDSESCIRLVDVDEDGRLDILLGTLNNSLISSNTYHQYKKAGPEKYKEFCTKNGLDYPCVGKVIALRGYDGKELWQLSTKADVFLMVCSGIDVDKDGKDDCVLSGHLGTLIAIDPRKGKILWSADETYLVHGWNVYQALVLPDFDEDNVADLLVLNGGNPLYSSETLNREAGRFLLFSGATGKSIGGYLNMSDNRETYSSPVLYKASDGLQYVLFGDGGETIPGSFMGISLLDLYQIITKTNKSISKQTLWKTKPRNQDGFITIYKSPLKGVMVPPVMVDVNRDGTTDILMSAYDGTLTLYDGADLTTMWNVRFSDMESYSSPAPGFFDDDEYLDFMMHVCAGKWPEYNYSLTVVVSGRDGKILWETASRVCDMSSDLVLQTDKQKKDLFVYQTTGNQGKIYIDSLGKVHGIGMEKFLKKRHVPPHDKDEGAGENIDEMIANYKKNHLLCEDDLSLLEQKVLLLDASNPFQPTILMTQPAIRFNYSLPPPETGDQHMDKRHEDSLRKQFCAVLASPGISTGVIDDVDGDGTLDYIHLSSIKGELQDEFLGFVAFTTLLTVQKINVDSAMKNNSVTPIKAITFVANVSHPAAKETLLLPPSRQVWNQYLGINQNSIYTRIKG